VHGQDIDENQGLAAHMIPPRGDRAIRSRTQDSLNRASLANAIAQQIASADADEEVVFGLVGSWGSGKTSLLNMTAEALEENSEDIVVLRFNPWLFSGTEHLVGIFFEELGAQLSERSDERLKAAGEALERYGRYLGMLRVVPGIGPWAAVTGAGTEILGRHLSGSDEEPLSLRGRKRVLEEALKRIHKKIVVMVDDLDRMSRQQEVRDVVSLVRLNADLPNVVFVLAYDRRRVQEALAGAEGDGRAYLEKIVQVVYDVPKSRDIDLSRALGDAINEAIDDVPVTGPYDEHRLQNIYHSVIRPLVRTIRDLRRYANVLPVTLRVIGDEVDLADVLALEAIRVLLPDAFATLTEAAKALTTPSDQLGPASGAESTQAQEARSKIEAFVRAGGPDNNVIREAQGWLFPASLWVENNAYPSGWLQTWSKNRLVAHPRVLHFYLEKQLPENVLPARDVQEIFEALGDRERLEALLGRLDSRTLEHLLERLENYEDDYPPEHVEVAVEVLLNQLPRLREGTETFSDLGADRKLRSVILRLLRRVDDQEELARTLRLVMPRIETFSGQLQLARLLRRSVTSTDPLVPEEEVAHLEEQWLTAVEHADPDALRGERHLTLLLLYAREIDSNRGAALAAQLAESDEAFLAALRSVYREVHSATSGDVIARTQYELNWDTLCSVFGEDTCERRVDQLSKMAEAKALNGGLEERTMGALRLAQHYAAGWRPDW
jgi:hypothetical protein